MATHFARWTINPKYPFSSRLNDECHAHARQMPEHRRSRFLASRSLLAELLHMLYGIQQLPRIVATAAGRPHFADPSLMDFSIAYAGNNVAVLITTEGRCGLDIEINQSFGHLPSVASGSTLRSNESIWINNQKNPDEARAQLRTLHQSTFKLTGREESLQLLPGAGRIRASDQSEIEAISDVEGLLIWGCVVSPAIEKLSLWEFEAPQNWHSLGDVKSRYRDPNGSIIRLTSMSSEKVLYQN
ncbi:phosphopantetheinyl transferase [Buttiauxella sp. BIGb0552]|jgi:phosphopantetheinyl transferase|uniref:4'-phosphopantetheinyl transferase family protein n=1 Tax=Buttiauxella sp. BIGb0552 TaxID=2485120 RepID=UPI0010660BA6|nr:hypothetical protein [Buttiauxella sp. BIGb0552]TDX16001.1 phosphopantetheinyl transferase [Buttiauxella sp. BIGb0552]